MMLLSLLLGVPGVIIEAQSADENFPNTEENPPNEVPEQDSSQTKPSISTDGNVEHVDKDITLVGQIGPYDPSEGDPDDPKFNDFSGENLEGTIPENYFTIAVTVPTALSFAVLEHQTDVRGQFYSPEYKVTNNATRPVHISVVTVNNFVYPTNAEDFIPLYLEEPVQGDKRVQIDLNLSLKNMKTSVLYNVNLTSLKTENPANPIARTTSNDTQNVPSNYLGVLGLKEQGILKFNSTSWERPIAEGSDKNAKVNFDTHLTFSLDDPTKDNVTPDGENDSTPGVGNDSMPDEDNGSTQNEGSSN